MPILGTGGLAESLISLTYPASLIWQKWGISYVIVPADKYVRYADCRGLSTSGNQKKSLTLHPESVLDQALRGKKVEKFELSNKKFIDSESEVTEFKAA